MMFHNKLRDYFRFNFRHRQVQRLYESSHSEYSTCGLFSQPSFLEISQFLCSVSLKIKETVKKFDLIIYFFDFMYNW